MQATLSIRVGRASPSNNSFSDCSFLLFPSRCGDNHDFLDLFFLLVSGEIFSSNLHLQPPLRHKPPFKNPSNHFQSSQLTIIVISNHPDRHRCHHKPHRIVAGSRANRQLRAVMDSDTLALLRSECKGMRKHAGQRL